MTTLGACGTQPILGADTIGRVLQVVTDRDRRGAQVFARDLHAYLQAQGTDVETVALRPGVSQVPLDLSLLAPGRVPGLPLGALRERMHSADAVVAHGSRTLMATALASQRLRVPIIYRQISDLEVWASTWSRRTRVRAYFRRMSHVVALWEGSKEVLISGFGVPARRISVVPNGVRAEVFQPPTVEERRAARARFGLPSDVPVAVCAGALVPEKGVDLAIQAVAKLPAFYLLVVGSGPSLGDLSALAGHLCAGRVVFTGSLDDIRCAYSAADMLVSPSHTEQMPATVIEAALCGLPAIGTRVGAIPTMICDGETGFLVNVCADEIADRMERVLKLSSLGEAARNRCLAKYTMGRVGEMWRDVLERQMQGG